MRFLLIGTSALALAAFAMFLPNSASAADYRSPEVKAFSVPGADLLMSFNAYDAAFKGGGEIAVGDIFGNSEEEIMVGAGRGGGPHVRVFNRIGQWTGYAFFPFHPDFRGGIDVALGDTDGDGELEVIVSQASGGQAWVKVYESDDAHTINAEFIAYGLGYEGGANVTAADIDGDGIDEIITASNDGSPGHIRAFRGNGDWTGFSLFPFEDGFMGGADVAGGNVDGGTEDELIISKKSFGPAQIKVYKTDSSKRVIADFLAIPDSHQEGANVATGDFDQDGEDEIVVGTGGNGPQVLMYESYGVRMPFSTFAYENGFRGGVRVAAGNIDLANSREEVLTVPGRRVWEGRSDIYKYVDVNLSEQYLRAYEGGRVVMEFPISSGVNKYPTPEGEFEVLNMNPLQDYRWNYGPDHLDNYDLKDVPWNMRFSGPYFLHGAYWHNNFGNQMSHGCVNISIPNAKRIYDWLNPGDKVIVHR